MEKSQQMNEVFNKFIVQKKPFVTLKSGITLDGRIATHSSDSKWITSEQARKDVQQLRNEHMAILVGVVTVIKDNPELTTRIPNGRNPIRVVMDSSLKIPLDSKLITDKQAETWIFTSLNYNQEKKAALESLGIKIFHTNGANQVNPNEVVTILGENLVSSLLIEGGGDINAAFFESQLIDKAVLYIAPKLIGGQQAPTFLEGTGIKKMGEAVELTDVTVESVGKDFKFVGYPVYSKK